MIDDVITDKDYLGFKRAAEDRDLRRYNERWAPYTCCIALAADDRSSSRAVAVAVAGTGHWSEGSLVRKLYSRTFRGCGESNPAYPSTPLPVVPSFPFPALPTSP